jgi:hypothetical protein
VAPDLNPSLAFGREVVAVGDDRVEIDEGEIAIGLARNARQQVGEARHLLALLHALGLDLGAGRIEGGIAGKHDGEAVGRCPGRGGGPGLTARA